MTLRLYIFLKLLGTFIAFLALLSILYYVDPFQSDKITILAFYVSLFLFLFGIFSLAGFFIRVKMLNRLPVFREINTAFREASILSFGVVFALYLQSQHLFNLFNMILLIALMILIEFFFLSHTYDTGTSQAKRTGD